MQPAARSVPATAVLPGPWAIAAAAALLVACGGAAVAMMGAAGVAVAAVAAVAVAVLGRRWLRVAAPFTSADPLAELALQREVSRGDAARMLALELAHDRARAVLESLREGVVVVDFGGEIVQANPAARHALSRAAGSPVGQLLWDVLPDELAAKARAAFAQLADDRTRQVRLAGVPAADRVFDITAVRVRSEHSGHDFGTVFLFVDSTHSHELVRLKDRFLSSMSHELRTPLTNICAYTEILSHLTPVDSAEWPEFLRIVQAEGLQLSQLVDHLFEYLQLESGEAKFDRIEVDPTAIVRSEFEQAQLSVAARQLQLHMEFAAAPVPHIQVDTRRLHHVCRQLLDNALKFTPAGGTVRVEIGALQGSFCLRVEDSGPGVPEEHRFTVFDKFNQLRDHLTEKPAGAGLGLASCRLIVSAHGGLIWCEPSPLGGAAFVVTLPAAVTRADNEPAPPSAGAAPLPVAAALETGAVG